MGIFDSDDDRCAYLQFLKKHTDDSGVEILAWCLMTNHVHFIVVPETELSLARAFGEAHRSYTRMKNFREDVRGYLFQGRFGSCVLDELHLIAAARYVNLNPVRAKMVNAAWDYEWSSARFHVGVRGSDPLVKDRTLKGLVNNWREILTEGNEDVDKQLRERFRTGRPLGNDDFLLKVERITGRDLSKKKPGRPSKGT
ncbi:transposase [Geomonas anaerohicana]|nr:transposase [Geomonas anaerohicana]